jgi:hypothetical protein
MSSDPVNAIVKGYLIEHVRSLADADPELFVRAFELYDTLEEQHAAAGHDHLHQLKKHPMMEKALGLLGERAPHVYEAAVRITQDNAEMAEVLRERLAELGVDPTTEEGHEEATLEYERILAETVSLDDSLDNVVAVADAIELGNDFLNAESMFKRAGFRAAWAIVLPLAVKDAAVRERVDSLKDELTGDPARLQAMADLVRKEGPRIVREAYERGSE